MNPQIQLVTRSQRAHVHVDRTEEEKNLVAQNVISKKWTYKVAATKSHVSVRAVQKWVAHFENDERMHGRGGRPRYINPDVKKRAVAELTGNGNSKVKCSKKKLAECLQAAADETRTALNKPLVKLSPSYIRAFQKENNINEGNAEVIDQAHFVSLMLSFPLFRQETKHFRPHLICTQKPT